MLLFFTQSNDYVTFKHLLVNPCIHITSTQICFPSFVRWGLVAILPLAVPFHLLLTISLVFLFPELIISISVSSSLFSLVSRLTQTLKANNEYFLYYESKYSPLQSQEVSMNELELHLFLSTYYPCVTQKEKVPQLCG